MNSTWKAALGVLLVFILGWAAGVLCHMVFIRHQVLQIIRTGTVPEAAIKIFERRMTYNLGLTDSQQQQIHDDFLENLQQRRALQMQIQPQVQQVNRQTLREIDSILTPDQQAKLKENLAEFRQRFGKNPFNPTAGTGDNQPPANPPPVSSPTPASTNAP